MEKASVIAQSISENSISENRTDKIEETIRKERGRLFNFIKKRVPAPEDAEDVLQDVFYQLLDAYRAAESIEKVTSWLFTVARNKITDLYRKKKAEPFSKKMPNKEDVPSLEDILPDLSTLPDQVMARQMIWEALEEALEELPPKQKEVFEMHEFEQKSFKEISTITGEGQNTLLSRKRYAVLHLRERLRAFYEEMIF